ncbi:MAG TPA: hypothetical protein VD928_02265 [Candidatus Paceibacterota bacterium]|nr:hypothetical protein [Candidatus Paceibacterota bacterium]
MPKIWVSALALVLGTSAAQAENYTVSCKKTDGVKIYKEVFAGFEKTVGVMCVPGEAGITVTYNGDVIGYWKQQEIERQKSAADETPVETYSIEAEKVHDNE